MTTNTSTSTSSTTTNNNAPLKTTNSTPTIFSMDDYVIPEWSGMPNYKFEEFFVFMHSFEIIKDGCILGKIDIRHKQFSLVGRLEDLCDLHIDNQSVSRKHAILQFHKDESEPYLYDLGSPHGTFVNREKLTPKVYKKLMPFMNVKFGVSSRSYVLRCPQLEEKEIENEESKLNEFVKVLNEQNKQLSKKEAKDKYLNMLETDPIFGSDVRSRKLQGCENPSKKKLGGGNNEEGGISWGISDEAEVYAYRNDKEYPIEPDIIRRLPGLDQQTLDKVAQFEEKFRHYEEIESELNELAAKEQREYGLEEKHQTRKEKLQKRFVEALEALEKAEDWIRNSLFGDDQSHQQQKRKTREKEVDTFEDDDFYDRTLENKNKAGTIVDEHKKVRKESKPTTSEDLWQLKHRFTEELTKKRELLSLKGDKDSQVININETDQEIDQQKEQDDDDELEQYMKENNEQLDQENNLMFSREMTIVEEALAEIRNKLQEVLSEKEIAKMEDELLNPERIKENEEKKQKKKELEKQRMSETLDRLEKQEEIRKKKEQKRQELLEAEKLIDDEDEKIFELYKNIRKLEGEQNDEDNTYSFEASASYHQQYKRPSASSSLEEINEEHEIVENRKRIKLNQVTNQENQIDEESLNEKNEVIVDLTKRFQQ